MALDDTYKTRPLTLCVKYTDNYTDTMCPSYWAWKYDCFLVTSVHRALETLWQCAIQIHFYHYHTITQLHKSVHNTDNLVAWWRGVVVASLVYINEVNLRWARLVLGWVTVSGFDSRRRHFISVCNQPPRSTQPCTLRGTVKWVQPKGGDVLRLGSKDSHGVICR